MKMVVFIGMSLVFRLSVVGVSKPCRMHCGGGERKHGEQGGIIALPAVCLRDPLLGSMTAFISCLNFRPLLMN
jgi:hypothetical protein